MITFSNSTLEIFIPLSTSGVGNLESNLSTSVCSKYNNTVALYSGMLHARVNNFLGISKIYHVG